jgi:hypothetical protein
VFAVALEDLVLAHVHFDVKIARRSAIATRLASPDSRMRSPVSTPAGILTASRLERRTRPLAEAVVAGILDRRAGTAALRAGLLQLEEALRDAHLPTPLQVSQVTGLSPWPRRCRRRYRTPRAWSTSISGGVAEHGLVEIELEFVIEVGAAKHLRATPPRRPPPKMSPNISPNISPKASPPEAARDRRPVARRRCRVAVLVVDGALVRLAETS